MSTDLTTVKKLYAFSYNECAHPDCNQVLVEIDSKTGKAVNYGELAHIHGQKPGTERFLQEVYDSKNELHGFENILILCAKHHHQVDQPGAGELYTADILRKWKMQHIQSKSATELDREWIYGRRELIFWQGDEQVSLNYWTTKHGELRFHTPEQLRQCEAAKDLSVLFAQISSITNILDQATGEPTDPTHQTLNDGYIRILKDHGEKLKMTLLSQPPKNPYGSAIERIYQNLKLCPDITLSELAQVGIEKNVVKTTLIVGEATAERIGVALQGAKDKAIRTKD